MIFRNSIHAGEVLGKRLIWYKGRDNVVIAGILRGGIETAYGISKILEQPLFPLIVARIYPPSNLDWTLGTMDDTFSVKLYKETIRQQKVKNGELESYILGTKDYVTSIKRYFGTTLTDLNLQDKTVILTDDGMASGYSMMGAILAIRKLNPKKIVLALPFPGIVGALAYVNQKVDESHVLETPFMCFSKERYFRNSRDISKRKAKYLISRANNMVKNGKPN